METGTGVAGTHVLNLRPDDAAGNRARFGYEGLKGIHYGMGRIGPKVDQSEGGAFPAGIYSAILADYSRFPTDTAEEVKSRRERKVGIMRSRNLTVYVPAASEKRGFGG